MPHRYGWPPCWWVSTPDPSSRPGRSLATLLWAARCRSAGVAVSWRRFAARGAVLVPLLLTMSVTSLWLAHG